MDNSQIKALLILLCECEDDIDISCHFCQILDHLNSTNKKLERMNEYRFQYNVMLKENKAMRYLFKLQKDALDNYYHVIHKCPCKHGGKCESHWRDNLGQKGSAVIHSRDDGQAQEAVAGESGE